MLRGFKDPINIIMETNIVDLCLRAKETGRFHKTHILFYFTGPISKTQVFRIECGKQLKVFA